MKVQDRRAAYRILAIGAICLASVLSNVEGETRAGDIVDTAVSAGDFDTLVAAVKAADLVDTLRQPGPFTVFAPTDEAFGSLPPGTLETLLKPENKQQLASILTYHVVPGRVTARDAFGLDHAVSVNGQRVEISRHEGKLRIGGAKVVNADINCSNGVIHVIDRVLLPEQSRIPAVAEEAENFKTLLAAATAAGLAEVLDGAGPFTVFAPTDEAFARLPEGTVSTLLQPENKEKLVDLLKYHVVAGRVYSDQAAAAGQAATLFGPGIQTAVTADGLKVNDAIVLQADLEAANGVIHVIDTVLMPKPMTVSDALGTLREAINRGVPIFNHGDHRKCAEIYMTACETIVDSESPHLAHDTVDHLRRTVEHAKRLHHSTSRAWALRHGMDSALASMRRMMPENVQ